MPENTKPQEIEKKAGLQISEDWLAVLIASLIILLSAIGILGENGLQIHF